MRVTRGFFRLWVVASVTWVLFVGVMTWQTWPEPVFAANAKLEPLEQQGPWTLARDVDGAK